MSKEPTNVEVLGVINGFATKIESDIQGLKSDVGRIESQMVTKDYLDDKMADLRGDLVVLIRKEDTKVKKLVDVLQKKNVLSEEEGKEILSMEPFPQLSL